VPAPSAPIAAAVVLYRAWRRLPPHQRKLLLDAARTHGPTVAAKAGALSRQAVASKLSGRR
jgi:hypothetical protein